MDETEDSRYTYCASPEAWYASAPGNESCGTEYNVHRTAVNSSGHQDGVHWEFAIKQHILDGEPALQLRIFDDAWQAFADVPLFFEQLRRRRPTTLNQLRDLLRDLLDDLGFIDITSRHRNDPPVRIGLWSRTLPHRPPIDHEPGYGELPPPPLQLGPAPAPGADPPQ